MTVTKTRKKAGSKKTSKPVKGQKKSCPTDCLKMDMIEEQQKVIEDQKKAITALRSLVDSLGRECSGLSERVTAKESECEGLREAIDRAALLVYDIGDASEKISSFVKSFATITLGFGDSVINQLESGECSMPDELEEVDSACVVRMLATVLHNLKRLSDLKDPEVHSL